MPHRIGARIRVAREQKKLTQQALGRTLGVSFQMVQRYERGDGELLSCDRLCIIARVLQVSPEWLLTGAILRRRALEAAMMTAAAIAITVLARCSFYEHFTFNDVPLLII